jgi:hypothetical protein
MAALCKLTSLPVTRISVRREWFPDQSLYTNFALLLSRLLYDKLDVTKECFLSFLSFITITICLAHKLCPHSHSVRLACTETCINANPIDSFKILACVWTCTGSFFFIFCCPSRGNKLMARSMYDYVVKLGDEGADHLKFNFLLVLP